MALSLHHPKTIEELMIEIGKKEQDTDRQIIFTVELIADIATRIIRLEEKNKNA